MALFYKIKDKISYTVVKRYKFINKVRFKFLRFLLVCLLKSWVRRITGLNNVPEKGPAIFVCNHLSYFDFLIFSAVVKPYVVFLAQRKIKTTFIIRWFTKFNNVIYIDKDYPGYSFFKELLQYLDAGRLIVVYPEGTRSRTGKMLIPKPGFVKLAMKANVPIILVALKGTYEILPPHRHIPRLRKCEVIIGKKMYISPDNQDIKDIFFRRTGDRKFGKLTDEDLQEIAIRLMDKIRIQAGEEWDESAVQQVQRFGIKERMIGFEPAIQT